MDKASDSSTDSKQNEQQGIFSTPELTVDAEKLAQNAEVTKEASRAKIASIFANTETGQQAQKLNDAMNVGAEHVTEDIVIDSGRKKKSKVPIIMAIVALALIAVGVGAWFLVQNLGNQSKEKHFVKGDFDFLRSNTIFSLAGCFRKKGGPLFISKRSTFFLKCSVQLSITFYHFRRRINNILPCGSFIIPKQRNLFQHAAGMFCNDTHGIILICGRIIIALSI